MATAMQEMGKVIQKNSVTDVAVKLDSKEIKIISQLW